MKTEMVNMTRKNYDEQQDQIKELLEFKDKSSQRRFVVVEKNERYSFFNYKTIELTESESVIKDLICKNQNLIRANDKILSQNKDLNNRLNSKMQWYGLGFLLILMAFSLTLIILFS